MHVTIMSIIKVPNMLSHSRCVAEVNKNSPQAGGYVEFRLY